MSSRPAVSILIVEDDPTLREMLAERLAQLEFLFDGVSYKADVHHAVDGASGLAKSESQWFDAILTDINMPAMDGLEMLRAIRGSGNDAPVVVLTGASDRRKFVEAIRLGCYAFLEKPSKSEEFIKIMRGAIEQGFALRGRAEAVVAKVSTYQNVSQSRRRQLQSVFRSMIIGADGLHRDDVCIIPDRPSGKKAV